MNRRDSLKLLTLAASAGAFPGIALAHGARPIAIYDGRFAEGRAFARTIFRAHDCRHDAAALWFAHFAGKTRPDMVIVGLTSAADALVLADCARREGLGFRQDRTNRRHGPLVAWTIQAKGTA